MLTHSEREMALEYLDEGYDLNKIARRLGVSRSSLRNFQGQANTKFQRVSDDGLGRESLREFVVAVKNVNETWDNSHPDIVAARRRYDDGVSEVCIGRDGDNQILYEIPRQFHATKRAPYFSRHFGDD